VVRHGDHGATVVEFGDEVHGDRPSPGSSIAARYRGHHLEVFSREHPTPMCVGLGS